MSKSSYTSGTAQIEPVQAVEDLLAPPLSLWSRMVRFGVVGGAVLLVDLGVIGMLRAWLPPLVTVSVAYAVAVSVHFMLNRLWVFGSRNGAYGGQILRYLLNLAFCWLCTVALVSLSLHCVSSNLFLAKLLALPPTTCLGFLLLRYFVFKPS